MRPLDDLLGRPVGRPVAAIDAGAGRGGEAHGRRRGNATLCHSEMELPPTASGTNEGAAQANKREGAETVGSERSG